MKPVNVVARTIPALAVVLLLGAGAYVVVPGLRGGDEVDIPAAPTLADWPERVRPYVRFVERERSLSFREVTPIDFLTPEEFEEEVTDEDTDLTEEDRAEIEKTTGTLRALGLVDEGVDLFAEAQRLQGAAVIGLYSLEDERIRVRGDELTTAVAVTLVHELTHALQDQHFDIGDRIVALSESEDDAESNAAGPFRAIIEGDASRVETAYVESLPRRTQAALRRGDARDRKDLLRRSEEVPPILKTLLGAPYALGEPLLDLAVAVDDDPAVDELLENPPTTDEPLLDPWSLLGAPLDQPDPAVAPVDVEVPAVGDGETEVDSGLFGALGWYVVLAQRVDPRTALRATDGWGGDAFSTFERDGRSCVRIAFRGDSRRDVDQMADALDEWITGSPESALLQRTRAGLVFSSCETPEPAPTRSQQAVLEAPVIRTALAAQVLESGGTPEFARCAAQKIADELTVAEINSNTSAVTARIQALARSCA